jgi:meiotically up-regulated gene 157 (Mug157) protein
MHETFWRDDPARYTRPWFAWANTLFGELIVTLDRDRPGLLRQPL